MHSSFIKLLFCLLPGILISCTQSQSGPESKISVSLGFSGSEEERREEAEPLAEKVSLNAADYVEWVRLNLHVKKQIGDMKYEAFYQPQEYVLLREKERKAVGSFPADSLQEDGFQHFVLTITHTQAQDLLKGNGENQLSYQDRLQYFSYQMQNDIQLLQGSDTLSCKIYHFERTFGLAPYGKFVLAFEKGENIHSEKTFILHDQLNGNGIIKLRFSKSLISQIPNLIYE